VRDKSGFPDCGGCAGALGMFGHLLGMNQDLPSFGLEPLLSVAELAEYLGIPIATIYDWRSNGVGPVGYRLGKHVKFAVSDVRAWLENQRDKTESDSPAISGGAK